jgi:hypothetical protein
LLITFQSRRCLLEKIINTALFLAFIAWNNKGTLKIIKLKLLINMVFKKNGLLVQYLLNVN